MEVDEQYEVCATTMAIVPHRDVRYQTKIFDVSGIVLNGRPAESLIEDACLCGGSSLEGRRKAAIYNGMAHRKVPIAIDPKANIYTYPTASPDAEDCCWIFYAHVTKWEECGKGKTIITLSTGQQIEVPVSVYSIERQHQRTAVIATWMTKRS